MTSAANVEPPPVQRLRAPTPDREERERLLAEHKRLDEEAKSTDYRLHLCRERVCRLAETTLEPKLPPGYRADVKKRLAAELAEEKQLVEAHAAAERAKKAAWHAWERSASMCPCEPCYWIALDSRSANRMLGSAAPRLRPDGTCASCEAGHHGNPCEPCACPGCVV